MYFNTIWSKETEVINNKRRNFLKGATATSVVAVAAGAGLLRPATVWAADWPKAAFNAKTIDQALQELYGSKALTASKGIKINANLQAENGAMVPVQVESSLKDVDAISVYVKENASPLVANVKISGAAALFRANIKMLKTSDVIFVVRSGGKLYTAKQNIKVTAGGCGG
jgi:sulfur-oxidizing protein SoxY